MNSNLHAILSDHLNLNLDILRWTVHVWANLCESVKSTYNSNVNGRTHRKGMNKQFDIMLWIKKNDRSHHAILIDGRCFFLFTDLRKTSQISVAENVIHTEFSCRMIKNRFEVSARWTHEKLSQDTWTWSTIIRSCRFIIHQLFLKWILSLNGFYN